MADEGGTSSAVLATGEAGREEDEPDEPPRPLEVVSMRGRLSVGRLLCRDE